MALDSKSIRRDFPIFQRWEGKNPLVYLDNAATSQKPRAVIDAVNNYYERLQLQRPSLGAYPGRAGDRAL